MGSGTSKNNREETYKIQNHLLDNFKECSICFEEDFTNDELFVLSCNHIFCLKCLQKHYIEFFNKNLIKKCPLCRKNSSIQELKKIYENFKLTSYEPIGWNQENTIDLLPNLLIKRLSSLNLNNDRKLLFPYYEINKIEKPLFFHSSYFNILNPVLSEDLDFLFCLSLDGILDLSKENCYNWHNFLKNNFIKKNYNNKKNYKNIFKTFEYSKIKIRFFIRDINKIVTYDTLNGTMEYGLRIFDRSCKVLFRTYLFETSEDTYIINELYSICY